MLDQQVALRIRELRKMKHLTQEALAAGANMDTTAIARIERGESSNIKLNTLEKIVKGLDISLPDFFSFHIDSEKVELTSKKHGTKHIHLSNEELELLANLETITYKEELAAAFNTILRLKEAKNRD
ncbi:helix-turn-helix transcriptional regulator [Streptococcus pneumoniae]